MHGYSMSVTIGSVLLSCGILAPSSSASVLVVDASGGGNYTEIQAAVDAAVDGDTLLVKSGTYESFIASDKALIIVGDTGAEVLVHGSVRVQHLGAQKTFVLENVTAAGYTTFVYGLYLADDQGHVRVESCHFTGAAVTAGGDAFDGIRIDGCNDASLTHVTSVGGAAPPFPNSCCTYTSGAGVHATNSLVTLYQSTLRGGNGVSAGLNAPDGGSGGDGCTASGAILFIAGTSCLGGNGGQAGQPAFGAFGGDGGDGIRLSPGCTAILLEDVEVGGAPGPASPFDPLNTSAGEPGLAREGSTFTDLAGTARRMHSPTPVRENTAFQLTFTGAPGEQVALVFANEADYQLKLAWKGVMLVKAVHPMLSIPVGTIPPGGTLTVPWDAPDLGGLPSRVFHLQPVFVDAQGHRTIGTASCMVILNHAY